MVIGENQHAVQETPLETDVLLSHFKFLSKILGFRFYFFLGGGLEKLLLLLLLVVVVVVR